MMPTRIRAYSVHLNGFHRIRLRSGPPQVTGSANTAMMPSPIRLTMCRRRPTALDPEKRGATTSTSLVPALQRPRRRTRS